MADSLIKGIVTKVITIDKDIGLDIKTHIYNSRTRPSAKAALGKKITGIGLYI